MVTSNISFKINKDIITLSQKFFFCFVIMNATFPPTWTTTFPSSCWNGYKLIHSISYAHKEIKIYSPPFFQSVLTTKITLQRKREIALFFLQLVELDCPAAMAIAFFFSMAFFILFAGANTTAAVVSTFSVSLSTVISCSWPLDPAATSGG